MSAMKSLQDRIGHIYYTHGLFCASHPFAIIFAVICVTLLACYPLTKLPLPNNAPLEYMTPMYAYQIPTNSTQEKRNGNGSTEQSTEDPKKPRWYIGPPLGYIQQFIVKATVSPWDPKQMVPTDAFRAPLSKVFDVLEYIDNFKITEGDRDIAVADVCLRVGETVQKIRAMKQFFPEYTCLSMSPAQLWLRDKQKFNSDGEIIVTMAKRILQTPPALQDLLFGVPWKKTGISRYFLHNKQRTVTFAITIVFKTYEQRFISSLRRRLEELYPDTQENVNNSAIEHIVHMHYRDINYIVEYTPLFITYIVLLLYIYFSVRKIELVKSKWGLAISAVATVMASLLISVSFCTLFGFRSTLNGGEIFPYLVVIIGLENVLVLTKSVVSTPVHLDVRHRVAHGLRKEGWFITKNLVTELLVILLVFFTFVPAIQEFCLFAVVGLLSDFFLQMVFFATVLSVDIRRMELSDLHKQNVQQSVQNSDDKEIMPLEPIFQCPLKSIITTSATKGNSHNSSLSTSRRSHNDSSGCLDVSDDLAMSSAYSTTFQQNEDAFVRPEIILKLPRRLRFIFFWARTRMGTRAIMVCTVIWLILFFYKTGLVEHIATQLTPNETQEPNDTLTNTPSMESIIKGQRSSLSDINPVDPDIPFENGDLTGSLDDQDRNDIQGHEKRTDNQGNGMEGKISISSEEDSAKNTDTDVPLEADGFLFGNTHMNSRIDDEEAVISHDLEHTDLELWRSLHYGHWMTLFGYYNISMRGSYISMLPSIHLSITVPPSEAIQLRHPSEQRYSPVRAGRHGVSGSVGDVNSNNYEKMKTIPNKITEFKLFPQNEGEFLITVILAILSVLLLVYFIVILYKCICTRRYPKWRDAWTKRKHRRKSSMSYLKHIQESVPLVLKGHMQEIECLVTEGQFIISACLAGQIRVWDSGSGECLSTIDRRGSRSGMRRRNVKSADLERLMRINSEAGTLHHRYPAYPEPLTFMENVDCKQDTESSSVRQRDVKSAKISNNFDKEPDLTSTIDTDFLSVNRDRSVSNNSNSSGFSYKTNNVHECDNNGSIDSHQSSKEHSLTLSSVNDGSELDGYNFAYKFGAVYDEHKRLLTESSAYAKIQRHRRIRSEGENRFFNGSVNEVRLRGSSIGHETQLGSTDDTHDNYSIAAAAAIWCLTCKDNLIVVGCSDGSIEIWDALTCERRCTYSNGSKVGVTSVCFSGDVYNWLIIARLNGALDFLVLDAGSTQNISHVPDNSSPLSSSPLTSPLTHHIHDGNRSEAFLDRDNPIHLRSIEQARAHRHPITVMQAIDGYLVTGSQDQTLKVFHHCRCQHVLRGHSARITSLHLDKHLHTSPVSGAANGEVRVWSLQSGTCLHALKGHHGAVTSITCSQHHVVSSGLDDSICVWHRKMGQLVYRFLQETCVCPSMVLLNKNLLVTGGQGCIYLWDLSRQEILRVVKLGDLDSSSFVRHLHLIGSDTIVCDYSAEIRVVHFPILLEKAD